MRKKRNFIPVNKMADTYGREISVEKIILDDSLTFADEAKLAHREDHHSFFLMESGLVHIEIDFEQYVIKAPSITYMHPDQVHRLTAFENVTVSSWAISNESLNPEYLKLLQDITPVKPLLLPPETFSLISEAVSLLIKIAGSKNDRLYQFLLKDSCNALVALVLSQFLNLQKPADKRSRFENVNKAFKKLLEHNYMTAKRPAAYAQKMNISAAYLNECVKHATGYAVSHHIQQRVILEAKRLLYHSDQSVKEIATVLGYDDYPYFSRLFTKIAGMTALAFRNKNLD